MNYSRPSKDPVVVNATTLYFRCCGFSLRPGVPVCMMSLQLQGPANISDTRAASTGHWNGECNRHYFDWMLR